MDIRASLNSLIAQSGSICERPLKPKLVIPFSNSQEFSCSVFKIFMMSGWEFKRSMLLAVKNEDFQWQLEWELVKAHVWFSLALVLLQ